MVALAEAIIVVLDKFCPEKIMKKGIFGRHAVFG